MKEPGFITRQFVEEAEEKVRKMAQIGCTDIDIGYVIGISERSVRNHFRDVINRGRGELRISLRKAQLECAIRDRVPGMLIWLGKQYLGQKDSRQQVENIGTFVIEEQRYSDRPKEN